jgi:exosome complex RNA-binding protein Rrp4
MSQKYRHSSKEVEAKQFLNVFGGPEDIIAWTKKRADCDIFGFNGYIHVRTTEDEVVLVAPDDYIIVDEQKNVFAVTEKYFLENYYPI